MKSRWKSFLKLQDKTYHVFASYCENNQQEVRHLLSYFEYLGCRVNDPEGAEQDGQPIFRNIIEDGIDQSKITVLFITKDFLNDEFCLFIANMAIWKYIITKGRHRVFPVLLDSCKVPKYLRVLHCIDIWKYKSREAPQGTHSCLTEVVQRLKKAFSEPPPKFKRIRWQGIKTLIWPKNVFRKMKQSTMKDEAYNEPCQPINPLHLLRLLEVLRHCYINCRYGHCMFSCRGTNFSKFIEHVKKCRYRPRFCPNQGCSMFMPNWQMEDHIAICKFTTVCCPSQGCGQMVQRCQINAHLKKCFYSTRYCLNYRHGCREKVKIRDMNAHLAACLVANEICEKCGDNILKRDRFEHDKLCLKAEIICTLCRKKMSRECKDDHQNECLMVTIKCPNIDCDLKMERYKLLQHQNECRYRIWNCPNLRNGCNFKGNRLQINSHAKECDCHLISCKICEKQIKWQDTQRHIKACEKTAELCRKIQPSQETVLTNNKHDSNAYSVNSVNSNKDANQDTTASQPGYKVSDASSYKTQSQRKQTDPTERESRDIFKPPSVPHSHYKTQRSREDTPIMGILAFVLNEPPNQSNLSPTVEESGDNRRGIVRSHSCAESRKRFRDILSFCDVMTILRERSIRMSDCE